MNYIFLNGANIVKLKSSELSSKRLLVFTFKCNLLSNASAKFLNVKILSENFKTSKSEIDEF